MTTSPAKVPVVLTAPALSLVDSDEYEDDEEQEEAKERGEGPIEGDEQQDRDAKSDESITMTTESATSRCLLTTEENRSTANILSSNNEQLRHTTRVNSATPCFSISTTTDVTPLPPHSSRTAPPPPVNTAASPDDDSDTAAVAPTPPFSPKHGEDLTSNTTTTTAVSTLPFVASNDRIFPTTTITTNIRTNDKPTTIIKSATAAAASVIPLPDSSSMSDEEYDVARRAAVQLAAVAAAATANHKSPALAAREARLVAQSLMEKTDAELAAQTLAVKEWKTVSYTHLIHYLKHNKYKPPTPPPPTSVANANTTQLVTESSSINNNQADTSASLSLSPPPPSFTAPPPVLYPHNVWGILCTGGNKPLLQHLLLLEHVRCVVDDEVLSDHDSVVSSTASASVVTEGTKTIVPSFPLSFENAAAAAVQASGTTISTVSPSDLAEIADRLLSLLKKVEGAYDSLLSLLPHIPQHHQQQQQYHSHRIKKNHIDDLLSDTSITGFGCVGGGEDMETPVVVPDLLPPCTAPKGDATLAFFRACVGHEEASLAAQLRAAKGPRPALGSGGDDSTKLQLASQASTAAASADASSNAASVAEKQQPTLFNMFKKQSNLLRKSFKFTKEEVNIVSSAMGANAATSAPITMHSSTSAHSNNHNNGEGCDPSNSSQYEDDEDCYPVKIEREMLGLTVENVLERTVVRTVLASGPAKKAGAKVGSLIVKVGNIETKNLTHFETIDELRQSQRPLQLIMKQISDDALRAAREEMGRLIKGSGFGNVLDGYHSNQQSRQLADGSPDGGDGRPLIGADLRIDAYTNYIKRRFSELSSSLPSSSNLYGSSTIAVPPPPKHKKEESLGRLGEKLVWILTLFAVGLQREACKLYKLAHSPSSSSCSSNHLNESYCISLTPKRSIYCHTASDYEDAAKSVSKVLMDFCRRNIDPQVKADQKAHAAAAQSSSGAEAHGPLRRRKGPAPPPPPPLKGVRGVSRGPGSVCSKDGVAGLDRRLMQIGDVLQRARTFLADTTSPPAALLRGELIAFLCDVLDVDTDMELAEEESASGFAGGSSNGAVSGSGGGKPGIIMDLGSAGSLLKLIVLNCPIMRSPGCEDASSRQERLDLDIEEELRRRFGRREKFTSSDLHKLHAGNRFLSVVHRLAASRSTSARIAACSLGPVLWGHLDFPHQLQLRGVITRALHDPEVIVRKSTATVLHEIAELVFDRRSVPWLVLMCERAMTDPEPQLRSAAMTLTWHLAEHLPNAFLGDASKGSRYLQRLPSRDDPIFADVYLLQCKILPVATRLAEDRSPSVRLAVAAQCDRLCDALGDHWSSVIIDVLLALLSDSDDRVRCEAVSCVPRLAEIVLLSVQPGHVAVSEVSILEALVPASIKLQKDPSPSVRVALAAAAGDLLALLVTLQGRADQSILMNSFTEHTNSSLSERGEHEGIRKYKRQVDDRLIPLVQALLNDKDPEVTSAALRAVTNATRSSAQQSRHRDRHLSMASEDDSASFSSFQSQLSDKKGPVLTPVLSEKQVLRLLPTLTDLANSRQWRVRQSAVEIVPALLGCTQQLETRAEISKLCIRLMSDQVDAVRKTAAECLCMGAGSLGSHGEGASTEWMASIVIPAIRKCAMHKESKQRLLSLKMIEVILTNGACPAKWKVDVEDDGRLADTPMRELVSIALSLTGDRIANVRLNVGRVLESVIQVFEDEELMFIKVVLAQQIESERAKESGGDRDVLYFGRSCINRAAMILEDRSIQQADTESPLHISIHPEND